jgi:hypothetical protein
MVILRKLVLTAARADTETKSSIIGRWNEVLASSLALLAMMRGQSPRRQPSLRTHRVKQSSVEAVLPGLLASATFLAIKNLPQI